MSILRVDNQLIQNTNPIYLDSFVFSFLCDKLCSIILLVSLVFFTEITQLTLKKDLLDDIRHKGVCPVVTKKGGDLQSMTISFNLEGNEYELEKISEEGQSIYRALLFTEQQLSLLRSEAVLLARAKKSFIEDLKSEVITIKSGVDLGALFGKE